MKIKEDCLNPCCFTLTDVRILRTNTTDVTVFMLLIFVKNLGFLYVRYAYENLQKKKKSVNMACAVFNINYSAVRKCRSFFNILQVDFFHDESILKYLDFRQSICTDSFSFLLLFYNFIFQLGYVFMFKEYR